MAAHIVKPELLAQEIGQRASVNELAAVIQQPGDIRNGRRLRQRPLDLVLRVHAASMRCARSIVQLYLRVKGRASPASSSPRKPAKISWECGTTSRSPTKCSRAFTSVSTAGPGTGHGSPEVRPSRRWMPLLDGLLLHHRWSQVDFTSRDPSHRAWCRQLESF